MTPDEHRIYVALMKWAEQLEGRATRRPFSFDRIRADTLRKAAGLVQSGEHR